MLSRTLQVLEAGTISTLAEWFAKFLEPDADGLVSLEKRIKANCVAYVALTGVRYAIANNDELPTTQVWRALAFKVAEIKPWFDERLQYALRLSHIEPHQWAVSLEEYPAAESVPIDDEFIEHVRGLLGEAVFMARLVSRATSTLTPERRASIPLN